MGCLLHILSNEHNTFHINYWNYCILLFSSSSLVSLWLEFPFTVFLANANVTDILLANASANPQLSYYSASSLLQQIVFLSSAFFLSIQHFHSWVRAYTKQLPALSLKYLIPCIYGQTMIPIYSVSAVTCKNSSYSKGFPFDL